MRVCQIGTSPKKLIPKRKSHSRAKKPASDVQASKRVRRNLFMSYFVTRKSGSPCSAGLRHYSHRALALLLEVDPEVLSWTTDGEPVSVEFKGTRHEVFPDFVVQRRSGAQAILVRGGKRKTGARLEFDMAIKAAYAERGIEFQAEFEEELLADPRVEVAKTILWHRPWGPSTEMLTRVAQLSSSPPANLGELQKVLGDEASWPFVVSLIARGWVDVGIPSALGSQTPIRACKIGGVG